MKISFQWYIFLLILLGSLNNQIGKYASAIDNFKRILEIKPKFTDAHYNLGVVYKKMGFYSEALKYYNKSYNISKDRLDDKLFLKVTEIFLTKKQKN